MVLRHHLSLILVGALTFAMGAAVLALRGAGAFRHALEVSWGLAVTIAPSVLGGLLLSGALRQLVPPGALAKWMGAESGWRGLVVATAAGMAMPGGPVAAFPVVLVLAQAGADRGALVAFVTAWSLNGFQRLVVWEFPILGADFALLRLISGLALPVIAGALARLVPIPWTTADAPALKRP